MEQHDSPRFVSLRFLEPSQAGDELPGIILVFFAAWFVLTLVGFITYLYVSGALQATHMRPFRFAVYILLLISAMTFGIKVIQQSSKGCEAVLNLEGNPDPSQAALATQC